MKQLLVCAFVMALFVVSSCKKNDDNNTPANRWVLNGTAHNVGSSFRNTASLYKELAMVSNGDTMSCYFTVLPTASGSYKIAHILDVNTASDMGVIVTSGSNQYATTGSDNLQATVTVNNGKISITMPDAWVGSIVTNDSVKLSATVVEP